MYIFSNLDFGVFSSFDEYCFQVVLFTFPWGKFDFSLISFGDMYDFYEFVYLYSNYEVIVVVGGNCEGCIALD